MKAVTFQLDRIRDNPLKDKENRVILAANYSKIDKDLYEYKEECS